MKGDKVKFGQNKKHLKTYKPIKKSIHNRRMVNITGELLAKPEFSQVKLLK